MSKNYTILQRINTPHRILPHTFDEGNKDVYSSIYIVKDGDMYGVIDDNGNEFIPCEYDNITVIGFGLFQLVRKGKLGLAHYGRDTRNNSAPFSLITLLPCEMDYVEARWYEETVILRKDVPNGMKVRAYFTYAKKLTEWYDDYIVLDRDIVEMRDCQKSYLYDARDGEMFCCHKNKSYITYNAFDDCNGECQEDEEHSIVIHASGQCESLICYGKNGLRIYYADGEINPVIKSMNFSGGHRLPVIGFVVRGENGDTLLSSDCYEMHRDSDIKVVTKVVIADADNKAGIQTPTDEINNTVLS